MSTSSTSSRSERSSASSSSSTRPSRSWLRVALRIGLLVLVLLFAYWSYIVYLVWNDSKLDQREQADAIVVLGAAQYNGVPSPVLRARLDHAVALWRQKLAPTIVVTGGRVPGDSHTEAGASAAYLGEQGVPDTVVLREVQGRSSWQSLQATSRFLKERGIHKVILVSDSFHNARVATMARDLGLDPFVSPTQTSPIQGSARRPYLMKEVVSLGLGKALGFGRVATLESNVNSMAAQAAPTGRSSG